MRVEQWEGPKRLEPERPSLSSVASVSTEKEQTMTKTILLAASLIIMPGMAIAQSTGNAGNPGAANTTDPNSAPAMGSQGTRGNRATTGSGQLDPAGRANTSDPGSTNSGGTNAVGQPANPRANPEER